jgi:DNA-binding MarR family transcriptional regulator
LEQPILAPYNLPYQMLLLVQQMTRRFQEILTPYGITPLHWGILCCLWEEDALPTSEIAKRLEQLGGTITVGLDTMERDGLIRRKKDRSDGRISRIVLLEKGRAMQSPLQSEAARLVRGMFSILSPEEYRILSQQVIDLRKTIAAMMDSNQWGSR